MFTYLRSSTSYLSSNKQSLVLGGESFDLTSKELSSSDLEPIKVLLDKIDDFEFFCVHKELYDQCGVLYKFQTKNTFIENFNLLNKDYFYVRESIISAVDAKNMNTCLKKRWEAMIIERVGKRNAMTKEEQEAYHRQEEEEKKSLYVGRYSI